MPEMKRNTGWYFELIELRLKNVMQSLKVKKENPLCSGLNNAVVG